MEGLRSQCCGCVRSVIAAFAVRDKAMKLEQGQLARRLGFRWGSALVAGLAALMVWPCEAVAVAPDSPEVKQMIERGLAWLEGQDDHRLGGKCLIGLSLYKGGRKADHPKIVAAVRDCETNISGEIGNIENYSVGLALIVLLETEPEKNRSLANRYLQEVLKRQQTAGGWGYPGNPQGDTSQTQYPTLALWLAANNGLEVPTTVIEKACGWLLRTQDPSGAWG